MKVLVACEFSGVVREAFANNGHDAWSCDLLPSEKPGNHIQGPLEPVLKEANDYWERHKKFQWNLIIAHPPCTHLASSGARWFKFKKKEQQQAIEFFHLIWNAVIEKTCIENPIGVLSTKAWKPDQIIQPWQFGHGETKATCLWLRGLPKLRETSVVSGREARVHKMPPSENRWKERSRTYQGIADAMADQWG
jgi:hypothetical protein